jgi:hypothetical protein
MKLLKDISLVSFFDDIDYLGVSFDKTDFMTQTEETLTISRQESPDID